MSGSFPTGFSCSRGDAGGGAGVEELPGESGTRRTGRAAPSAPPRFISGDSDRPTPAALSNHSGLTTSPSARRNQGSGCFIKGGGFHGEERGTNPGLRKTQICSQAWAIMRNDNTQRNNLRVEVAGGVGGHQARPAVAGRGGFCRDPPRGAGVRKSCGISSTTKRRFGVSKQFGLLDVIGVAKMLVFFAKPPRPRGVPSGDSSCCPETPARSTEDSCSAPEQLGLLLPRPQRAPGAPPSCKLDPHISLGNT